jgi:VanZ family protein
MLLMLVISTDIGSMQTSQRLMNPVFLWFDPTLSMHELYKLNIIFRKLCHVTEFAVLAMLVWRTRDLLKSPWPGTGTLRLVGLTLAVCAFFAISTELIQYGYRSRAASPWDILLNMGGSVLGLSLLFLFKKIRRKAPPKKPRILVAGGINLENAEDTLVLAEIWETVADTKPDMLVVLGSVGPASRAPELLALLRETASPARLVIHPGADGWQTAASASGVSHLDSAHIELEGVSLASGTECLFIKQAPPALPVVIDFSEASRPREGFRHFGLGNHTGGPRFALYDAATGAIEGPFSAALRP